MPKMRLPVTEELEKQGISDTIKLEKGHMRMLERGYDWVILEASRQFSHIRSGSVVVERGEIAAQLWADCHLRQWGFSEMEFP